MEEASFKRRNHIAWTAKTIRDMVTGGCRLALLLHTAKLAQSTYYYLLKHLDKGDKNKVIKDEMQAIDVEHKYNYSYRRIHLALKNRGYPIDHRKVQRLMKEINLAAHIRRKLKYSSYKGEVVRKPTILFSVNMRTLSPMRSAIRISRVTVSAGKLYLSPVLESFNSEIIDFTLSRSPDLKQVKTMLEKVFPEDTYLGTDP